MARSAPPLPRFVDRVASGRLRPARAAPGIGATIAIGAAAGAFASYAKALVEPRLQRLGESVVPPSPAARARPGADALDHRDQLPPFLLVRRTWSALGRRELDDDSVARVVDVIHYSFGVAYGVGWCALVRRRPGAALLGGTAAGAVLFAATHGSTLPAAGLQAAPTRMPGSWWVWEFGSHLAFGAAVEAVRRTVVAIVE